MDGDSINGTGTPGLPIGGRREQSKIILNTLYQNKFWIDQIFELKMYERTRKKLQEKILNHFRVEKVFLRKTLNPLALEEKIDRFPSTHTHACTQILHGKNHQGQRRQTGKNNCNSHQRQMYMSP